MRRRILALGTVVLVSSVFFIDACGLVFRCGCRSLWAGAAAACNIHSSLQGGPHCPWCAHPIAGGAVAFFAVAAVQALIVLRPGRVGLALRLALALLSFPVAAGVVGAIQGFLWDNFRP